MISITPLPSTSCRSASFEHSIVLCPITPHLKQKCSSLSYAKDTHVFDPSRKEIMESRTKAFLTLISTLKRRYPPFVSPFGLTLTLGTTMAMATSLSMGYSPMYFRQSDQLQPSRFVWTPRDTEEPKLSEVI
ncbi:hypothetical protein Droror1_Dr00023424 [Drosera rotundifolia]